MATRESDTGLIERKIVRKHLTCSICLEEFTEPKILPCTHTFCLLCLDTYVKGCAQNGSFHCAYCRELNDIPPGGVSAFKNSHLIISLQDDLRLQKKCDICALDQEEALATSACLECSDNLCSDCANSHTTATTTSAHTVVKLEDLSNPSCRRKLSAGHVFCTDHNDAIVRYFCVSCDRLICRDCRALDHQHHEAVSMETAARGRRRDLRSMLGLLLVKEQRIRRNIEHMKSLLNDLQNEEGLTTEGKMRQKGQKITSLRDALRQGQNQIHQSKLEQLTSLSQDCELLLTRIVSTKEYISKKVDGAKDSELLNVSKAMKESAIDLITYQCAFLSLSRSRNTTADSIKFLSKTQKLDKMWTLPTPIPGESYVVAIAQFESEILVCAGGKVFITDNAQWRDVSPPGQNKAYGVSGRSNSFMITLIGQNDQVKLALGNNRPDKSYILTNTQITSSAPAIARVEQENDELCYFVTDIEKGCVVKVNGHGQTVASCGQAVLSWPHFIAVGVRGEIITSDIWRDDVAILQPNGKLKLWLREHNNLSRDILHSPYGICTDESGLIFVASHDTHQVLLFTADGDFLRAILSSADGLHHPTVVDVCATGRLAVADETGINVFDCDII